MKMTQNEITRMSNGQGEFKKTGCRKLVGTCCLTIEEGQWHSK